MICLCLWQVYRLELKQDLLSNREGKALEFNKLQHTEHLCAASPMSMAGEILSYISITAFDLSIFFSSQRRRILHVSSHPSSSSSSPVTCFVLCLMKVKTILYSSSNIHYLLPSSFLPAPTLALSKYPFIHKSSFLHPNPYLYYFSFSLIHALSPSSEIAPAWIASTMFHLSIAFSVFHQEHRQSTISSVEVLRQRQTLLAQWVVDMYVRADVRETARATDGAVSGIC